jgi:hypothetical protein
MKKSYSTETWLNNEALFTSELSSGHQWMLHVASHLRDCGVLAVPGKYVVRDSVNDRYKFANEKDITFETMDGVIEVKSRRLSFGAEPNDYPKESAFVDTASGWKRKSPKPLAVVLVSQNTGKMLVIPTSTSDKWQTFTSIDKVRNIKETWLTIDKNLLKPMDQLVSWLLLRQNSGPSR